MTEEERLRYTELLRKMHRSRLNENPGPELTTEEQIERSRLQKAHRNACKEMYKPQRMWLSELLFRHDPIGLAACGCPADEYCFEAERIVMGLDLLHTRRRLQSSEIRKVVYRVFELAFDRPFRESRDPSRPRRKIAGEITDTVYGDIAEEIAAFIAAGHFTPDSGGA